MSEPNNSPVFFDFESNGLELTTFPIEVGFSWWDSAHVVSESHLILPDPSWDIENNWDDRAELIHGISVEKLRADGKPAFKVARRLNEALAGRELFADSPFDIDWMDQLFAVTEYEPAFVVRRTLPPILIEQLRIDRGLSKTETEAITSRVQLEFPHTHRAGPDSLQWAELWGALIRAGSTDAQ